MLSFSLSPLFFFFFRKPVDFLPSSTVCVFVWLWERASGSKTLYTFSLFFFFPHLFRLLFSFLFRTMVQSNTRERVWKLFIHSLSSYLYITHVSTFFRDFDIFSTTYKGKVCSPIGETASKSCHVFSLVLAFGCAHARALPFRVRVFCVARD